jgi:hypothetical protein
MDPNGETYPASHDENQAMNVKAEEVSDVEVAEDPVPITFPEIKAESEVSCMCTVRQITQICRSATCLSDIHLCLSVNQTVKDFFLKCLWVNLVC